MDSFCYGCHYRRNVATARSLGDEATATAFARELMQLYLDTPVAGSASPLLSPGTTALFQKYYGLDADRFRQEKADSNKFVLERLPGIRRRIETTQDPLFTALQFAILGNYIDFSALQGELTFEKLDELVVFAINQQLKQMKMDMKNLETQIRQKQPELDGKIAKLQAKIERNLEYRKRAYEQFMDEVLSKEEYLELKQMYETENQKYQKELSELNHEEQRQRAAVNETKIWLEHFNRRRITVKQLTREALVELVDKIYVYPEQKIDIYFKFASVESSPDRILEKDGVI